MNLFRSTSLLSNGTKLGPRHLAVTVVAALVSFASGSGQNVPSLKVMISGGFRAAYQELVPEFERKTVYAIVTAYGASIGDAPNAIPNRLQGGESDSRVGVSSARWFAPSGVFLDGQSTPRAMLFAFCGRGAKERSFPNSCVR
jgi:hypothetical protein